MNYIQRLFDSAGPGAGALFVPVAPPTAATSPVVAADQRLGAFPHLIDPFGVAAVPGAGAREGASAAPDRWSRTPEGSRPPGGLPGQRPEAPRQPSRTEGEAPGVRPAPEPTGPAPSPARRTGGAEARPVSPLQRLVESAPLSAPRPATPAERAESVQRAEPRTAAPTSQPSPSAEPEPRPKAAQPPATESPPPSIHRNPAEITPDQFRPHDPEPTAVAASEGAAAVPAPALLPAEPPRAESPVQYVRPVPLEPAADTSTSPFAPRADLHPLPPVVPPRESDARPVPERIIERIREVPVGPPTPPKAMTAAAQSVIGSLAQRGSRGWKPRQGF